MGLFDFFKKKNTLDRPPLVMERPDDVPPAVRMAEAKRYYEMYLESVELISKTIYCKTFFYRYGFALENAQKILRLSKGLQNEDAARDMHDILVKEKVNIVNDFLFRCYDAGKIQYVKKDIVPYMNELPKESKKLLQAMLEYESLDDVPIKRGACDELFAVILSAYVADKLVSGDKESRYSR